MNLHSHTPTLMGIDARGLSVRHVRFCRADELAAAEPRLVRQVFDLAGRLVSVSIPDLIVLIPLRFMPFPAQRCSPTASMRAGGSACRASRDKGWRRGTAVAADAPSVMTRCCGLSGSLSNWKGKRPGRLSALRTVMPRTNPLLITSAGNCCEGMTLPEVPLFWHSV